MEFFTGTLDQKKEKKKFKDMTGEELRIYIINKREASDNGATPEELVADTLPRLFDEVDECDKENLLEFYRLIVNRNKAGYNWDGGDHSDLEFLKKDNKTREYADPTEMYDIMDLECSSAVKYMKRSTLFPI